MGWRPWRGSTISQWWCVPVTPLWDCGTFQFFLPADTYRQNLPLCLYHISPYIVSPWQTWALTDKTYLCIYFVFILYIPIARSPGWHRCLQTKLRFALLAGVSCSQTEPAAPNETILVPNGPANRSGRRGGPERAAASRLLMLFRSFREVPAPMGRQRRNPE